MHEFVRFGSKEELAATAATHFLNEISSAKQRGQQFFVALSGGRIAVTFYTAVVNANQSRKVPFGHVHCFWADERCVPAADPDSNFGVAHRELLAPLEIPSDRIHPVRGEAPPAFAAAEAESEICRIAPLSASGQPILDLVILGMGEDGHVASLFPPVPAIPLWSSYLAVRAPKPPPLRISLNYPAIAAARQVWVFISGAGKEKALAESLYPQGKTPLAKVLRDRPETVLYAEASIGFAPVPAS